MSVYTNAQQVSRDMQKFFQNLRPLIMEEMEKGVEKFAESFLEDLRKFFAQRSGILTSRLHKRSVKAQELMSNEEIKEGLKYLDLVEIQKSGSGGTIYFTLLIPDTVQSGSKFSLVFISRSIEYGSKSMAIPPVPHRRVVLTDYISSLDKRANEMVADVANAINVELSKIQAGRS